MQKWKSLSPVWPHGPYTIYGILQAKILEWVAISFPRGSSQPRNQTQASWIAGGFFKLSHKESPKMQNTTLKNDCASNGKESAPNA